MDRDQIERAIYAFKTMKKNHAVSLKKGDDYVVLGYNDSIMFKQGRRLREYIEAGYIEVV